MRWSGSILAVALASTGCNGDGAAAQSETTGETGTADDPSGSGDDAPESSLTDPSGADPTTSPADSSGDGGSSSAGTDTGEPACDDLPAAITAAGMQVHLEALAQIASDNGGNRSVGTAGYDASVDYVRTQLESVGYTVSPQTFQVNVFSITGPSSLEWIGETSYGEFRDFTVATYSAAGSPTALATVVDPDLGLGNSSTSGCEAADFAGFPAGNIAIIQRGTCFLSDKVTNAQAAGASGVVIFNQGNDAGRMGLWAATLGAQTSVTIPVLLSSYGVGESIAEAGAPATVAMDVDVDLEMRPTSNLVIESEGGDADDVLMLGAHLDGVPAGPGINDNGSGSAALLEVALAMHGCETTRKVRFAWWAAEEVGLIGSQVYVASLDQVQRGQISLYMNFDMIGSPNWVRFRYDGDGSAFGNPGPMGSAELEQVFADWFDGKGMATEESPFDGRSDHGSFLDAGIASGGLATGAEGIKSEEQAMVHGGVAGEPYDACYHAACDGVGNIDFEVLEAMGGAIAHAVSLYALP